MKPSPKKLAKSRTKSQQSKLADPTIQTGRPKPVESHGIKTMIASPWMNRLAALVLLFAVYSAGIASGRDQAVAHHQNHAACHQALKP